MAKKRIARNFYAVSVAVYEKIPKEEKERLKDDPYWKKKDYWYVTKKLPDNRLYAGWSSQYPTKLTPEDLPEDYILLSGYKKHGYIRTAGVTDLVYRPSYFHNHSYKDDFLFIQYGGKLPEVNLDTLFRKCDEYIFGSDIVDFVFAVEKNSPEYDVSEIKMRMVEKYNAYIDEMREWRSSPDSYKKIERLEDLRTPSSR